MTNRHANLSALLRSLNLGTMAATFDNLALKAAREDLSHADFLEELARLEAEERTRRRAERRRKESRLPAEKTFRTLERSAFPRAESGHSRTRMA